MVRNNSKISLFLVVAAILVFSVALMFRTVNAANASTSATVTNSLPAASSASLNGAADITLSANTTTSVVGEATITDNNGCEDVTSVVGKLFRTNITNGVDASDNNSTMYTSTCSAESDCTSGGSDLTVTYNCTFPMQWYAEPTDAGSLNASTNWSFVIIPSDGTNGTNATAQQEVNTLTSLGLQTTTISFGTLSLGANTTTTNHNTTVANLGNEAIDISLTGYAASSGDNMSMSCAIGNVSIDMLEYSASTFEYGSGTDLSNTTTELDFDLSQGSESTPRPTSLVHYGFGLPTTGIEGSCTGTVVISAVSDPSLD